MRDVAPWRRPQCGNPGIPAHCEDAVFTLRTSGSYYYLIWADRLPQGRIESGFWFLPTYTFSSRPVER